MNRLLAIDGGQLLKADDWAFIQDATAETIKRLLEGIMGAAVPCVITGLEVTVDEEEDTISVTPGVLFDGEELCNVPAAVFDLYAEGQGKGMENPYVLYLEPDITTGESRVFKDTTTHDVYQYRNYTLAKGQTLPQGKIQLPDRLTNIITQYVNTYVYNEIEPLIPAPSPIQIRTYTATVANLANTNTLIPAPGSGYAIKVVEISAKLTHGITIVAGGQGLDVFYGSPTSNAPVGSLPGSFISANADRLQDMEPSPGMMLENQSVNVRLSSGITPDEGYGTVKFYCYYVIITL